MTDPGLTDLIAAHIPEWSSFSEAFECPCGEFRGSAEEWAEHLNLVVEQHATAGSKQWRAMFRTNLERAEKAEATIARVEKALAEGPLHRLDFPRSKDPYGIERQAIREALDGGGDGCVAERG